MTSSELSYRADVPQIDTSKITAMEKYLIMHLIMCLTIKSKLVIGQCPQFQLVLRDRLQILLLILSKFKRIS